MNTQTIKALKNLHRTGYCSNFWAIQNYILRIGTRIYDLKNKGYKIIGRTGKEVEKAKSQHKNYYYYIA